MKARYNVLVNSDHVALLQKIGCDWTKLSTLERVALHDVVEQHVQAIQDAVPAHAVPAEQEREEHK